MPSNIALSCGGADRRNPYEPTAARMSSSIAFVASNISGRVNSAALLVATLLAQLNLDTVIARMLVEAGPISRAGIYD